MALRLLSLSFFLFFSSILSGCSLLPWGDVSPKKPVVVATSYEGVSASDQKPPFILEVLDDANDGGRFLVLVSLRAKTNWPAQEIGLRLLGLHEGKIVERNEYSVAELLDEVEGDPEVAMLEEGEDYELVLSTDAKEVTDYQVELFWGQEAKTLFAKNAERGELRLENVRIAQLRTGCPGAECVAQFQIEAELLNETQALIDETVLLIRFFDTITGVQMTHEERVSLGKLGLEPERARAIRLLIDSPSNDDEGTPKYRPQLSLLALK
ncbi:MAG: hypothetical protein KDD55_13000 [Bdellovibrionales bacterium]|nr:hypothetical protein [Bdellovibrionales bacterium]